MRALGLHDLQHVVGSSLFDWIQRAGRPLTLARPIGGFTPLVLEAGWSGEVRLQRRVERPGDEATSDFSLILRPIDADPPLLAGTAHDLAPQKRQQAELQSAVTRAATSIGRNPRCHGPGRAGGAQPRSRATGCREDPGVERGARSTCGPERTAAETRRVEVRFRLACLTRTARAVDQPQRRA